MLSHAVGILISIAFLVALLLKAQGMAQIGSAIAFGGGLIMTFTASTLYHAARDHSLRRRFRILDHTSIYLLIAGTYTPYMMVSIPDQGGRAMTLAIWVAAVLGVGVECLWLSRPKWLIAALYVGLGWCILFKAVEIRAAVGEMGFWLLMAGGGICTLSVLFYVQKTREFMHAVFHAFVFLSSIPTFISVYAHVFQ